MTNKQKKKFDARIYNSSEESLIGKHISCNIINPDMGMPRWFKEWYENEYQNTQPKWFKVWNENVFEPFKASVETDIKELKSDVRQLKSDVEHLKSDVKQLKSDVNRLNGEVFKLNNAVFGPTKH